MDSPVVFIVDRDHVPGKAPCVMVQRKKEDIYFIAGACGEKLHRFIEPIEPEE